MKRMHRLIFLFLLSSCSIILSASEDSSNIGNSNDNSKSKRQESLDFIEAQAAEANRNEDQNSLRTEPRVEVFSEVSDENEEEKVSEDVSSQSVKDLYEEVKRKHKEAHDIGSQVEILKKKLDLLKNFDNAPREEGPSTSNVINQLKEIILAAKKLKERNDKILESSFQKFADVSNKNEMEDADKFGEKSWVVAARALYDRILKELPAEEREFFEKEEKEKSSSIQNQPISVNEWLRDVSNKQEDFYGKLGEQKQSEKEDTFQQIELIQKKLNLLEELEKGPLGSGSNNHVRPVIEQLKKMILTMKELKEIEGRILKKESMAETLSSGFSNPDVYGNMLQKDEEPRKKLLERLDRKYWNEHVASREDRIPKPDEEVNEALEALGIDTKMDNFKAVNDDAAEEPVTTHVLSEEEKLGKENFEKAEAILAERKPDYVAAYSLLEVSSALGNVNAKLHIAWSKLFGTLEQNIPKAVQIFSELAAQNNPEAQLALGFLHASGIGVKADQAKALVYYTFAAISGSTGARMALGYRYFAGATVQNSCERALDFYRLVANDVAKDVSLSGGPMVQRIRLLEEAENSGYNTGILENDLVEYYQLLAEKGDVKAQVGLGQLHYQGGRGVPLDVQKALQYFIPAAEAGNPIAMAFLGKIYLEGHGNAIKQDNQTAFKYFKKAADLNNPVGQAGLGLMYLEGRGVEKDYKIAHRYFSQAADQGWVDGQLQLGVMYFNGLGTRRDYKLANKYFSHASQSGHVLAFYNLAQMHATGTGVMRSCSTAVELYKNVAERGKWGEKLMIAHNLYRKGYINEAYVMYAYMAELGYEVAQSNAAFLLDKQEVTLWEDEKNIYVRALMYWGRAAGQGYSAAIVKLGDYHYYGLGTPVDYEVAAMHYRLASDQQHNAQAMFNLGYMHEQGLGMTKDIYLAKRCYDMAAETSADAKIPVALALAKLSILFSLKYFEEVKWFNWLFFFDLHHILGPYWDLYVGTFLIGLLGIIFYYRRFLPH